MLPPGPATALVTVDGPDACAFIGYPPAWALVVGYVYQTTLVGHPSPWGHMDPAPKSSSGRQRHLHDAAGALDGQVCAQLGAGPDLVAAEVVTDTAPGQHSAGRVGIQADVR